ncbi:unnamed protein product, partial [Pleuronectes platessa]
SASRAALRHESRAAVRGTPAGGERNAKWDMSVHRIGRARTGHCRYTSAMNHGCRQGAGRHSGRASERVAELRGSDVFSSSPIFMPLEDLRVLLPPRHQSNLTSCITLWLWSCDHETLQRSVDGRTTPLPRGHLQKPPGPQSNRL